MHTFEQPVNQRVCDPMDRLPAELIRDIVELIAAPDTYESRVDLGSLRLMNRQWSYVVSPLLFHTVPLWMSFKSLRALVACSNHPEL